MRDLSSILMHLYSTRYFHTFLHTLYYIYDESDYETAPHLFYDLVIHIVCIHSHVRTATSSFQPSWSPLRAPATFSPVFTTVCQFTFGFLVPRWCFISPDSGLCSKMWSLPPGSNQLQNLPAPWPCCCHPYSPVVTTTNEQFGPIKTICTSHSPNVYSPWVTIRDEEWKLLDNFFEVCYHFLQLPIYYSLDSV